MIGRRAALLGVLPALAGCGFRPLYGRYGATGGPVLPELSAIYVAVMSERQGQLLRQALQARLDRVDGVAKRFELTGNMAIAAEAIGVQQDTSSTRTRFNASASWVLRRLDLANTVVTAGVAKATDGYNVNNQEYFAADLEQSSAFRRLADTVADQITLDIASYFRSNPNAA